MYVCVLCAYFAGYPHFFTTPFRVVSVSVPRYLCTLVFALQCFIFSELVGVRKRQAAEKRLPLFRSIQWAWFFATRPEEVVAEV